MSKAQEEAIRRLDARVVELSEQLAAARASARYWNEKWMQKPARITSAVERATTAELRVAELERMLGERAEDIKRVERERDEAHDLASQQRLLLYEAEREIERRLRNPLFAVGAMPTGVLVTAREKQAFIRELTEHVRLRSSGQSRRRQRRWPWKRGH